MPRGHGLELVQRFPYHLGQLALLGGREPELEAGLEDDDPHLSGQGRGRLRNAASASARDNRRAIEAFFREETDKPEPPLHLKRRVVDRIR